MKNLILVLILLPVSIFAQKEVYIPNEWQQGGLDYSFTRSAQSGNFIVFWGPLAGDDPTQAPPSIVFDPQQILSTAEELYKFYIDTIQFLDDDAGLLSQYKIILVMLHTWTGLEGWAFGGNYDGTVGAMWMHPHAASSGPTLAHEFTHTLQNYAWMMNPGHGFIDSSYVGFFWETHAEFMALQKYPSVALEFDMARWLNTCQFHWSSTRHHYQAFVFLQFLKERHGIQLINRMWSESIIGEHPLETYMRLTGITQEELNYLFAEYAMRNVTWDYNIGSLLRTRVSSLNPVFVSHPTIIPELVDAQKNWYTISNHLAPQDYGYNIIRLYPEQEQGCSKRIVYVNFEELYIFPDFEEAGLLFGLVAVDENGEPRYSEIYKQDEITFELEDDENELYLVITGAPKNHHNYAWEIGFPKIYRFPYEFRLKNATPEGFQDGFNAPPVGIPGAPHINGGGFVATTAHVDATAYVGPGALVLDNAQVTGLASIDGNAVIKHNAKVEEAAHVSGTAIIGESARVYGAAQVRGQSRIYGDSKIYGQGLVEGNTHIFSTQVYDSAHLTHNTFCWGAELHGDVKLGGDAEFFRECSDGTYLQFQDAYGRNCDGLDNHPANVDVTEIFNSPKMRNLYKLLCDTLLLNHFEELEFPLCEGDTLYFNGVPITSSHVFEYVAADGADSIVTVAILHYPIPHIIFNPVCPGDTVWYNDTIFLLPGFPYDTMLPNPLFECDIHYEGTIGIVDLDSTVLSVGHSLDVQQPAAYIQWYDCATNLPIAGAHGQTYTPFLSGSYKAYVITIPDSCEFFTGCYDIIGTSTNDPEYLLSLDIHPNPVIDQVYLQISKSFNGISEVQVIDELGRMHFIKPVRVQPDSYVLDVAFLVPGMYLLNISSGSHQHATRRFVKIQQ